MHRVSQSREQFCAASALAVAMIVSLAISMMIGCKAQPLQRTTGQGTATQSQSESEPPLRGVAAIDETRSMSSARVPHVTVAALTPLFERLESSGGELAICFIRDRSDAPLLRLYVPAPPPSPVDRVAPKNVFEAASAKRREEAEHSRYALQRQVWRADAAARVNAFAGVLAQRLERAPDAARTDIRSTLVRANLFLAEPTNYERTPKNVAVWVTDGCDNTNTLPPPKFTVPVELLLVNGSGTVAYLAPLRPVRFESLEAALRFAVDEGGHRVRR